MLASVVALGLGLVPAAQGQDAGSGGGATVDQGRSPAKSRALAERSAAEEALDTGASSMEDTATPVPDDTGEPDPVLEEDVAFFKAELVPLFEHGNAGWAWFGVRLRDATRSAG